MGSKRTSVFGLTPDSLCQMTSSLVMAMRLGREASSGSGYSLIAIVTGSMLPYFVRAEQIEKRDAKAWHVVQAV